MSKETFADGSEIVFDSQGRVRSVTLSECCEHIFSEDKSLKQLALDLHHEQIVRKHCPKPAPEAETKAEAEPEPAKS